MNPALAMRGELRLKEPMYRHTSWRLGGPADRYYRPADLPDLCVFLKQQQPREPLTWVGLGSNLLVRDGGIRGTVIDISRAIRDLQRRGCHILAGAGSSCSRLARYSAAQGLTGAEFLIGIPGTLGGALAMNAGAFGGEIWALVQRVQMVDRNGALQDYQRADFDISYRSVQAPAAGWFVGVELQLQPDTAGQSEARLRELLLERASKQPLGIPSGGSVFRNPPGVAAGQLIERCGLKGVRQGGAQVSAKHANFILAAAPVKAADVEALICRVQQQVLEHCGIRLIPEVHIIGDRLPTTEACH